MSPSQPAISQWGWGFHNVRGGIDLGDLRFRPRFLWSCRYMEGFLIRRRGLILLVSGGTSTLARGATLAACWLHEPQPISNQLAWCYRAGWSLPAGSAYTSPCCWSCRYMEVLIREGEHILPGCGGTSVLARGVTLAARGLHEPHPIGN